MSFLAPWAFWLGLVLPVVVVFYLLKRRRQRQVVPSTLLWERFLAEHQANAPFQRLRHNWLLLLQLLLLLLIILALGRPYIQGEVTQGGIKVLIIDASASMQSRDVSPSRFEKARSTALEWVNGLEEGTQMVIIQAAGRTEVKQSATGDKRALRRAVESLSVTDGPTRMNEAFKLAATLVQDRPQAEIHLFSDGAFFSLDDFALQDLPLVYHQIGKRSHNVGITSLDVRPDPKEPQQRAVFAKVENFADEPIGTEIELYFREQLLEVRSLALGPTNSTSTLFHVSQPEDGYFKVALSSDDDLPADNQARIVSHLPEPIQVLLVSEGNRFLEKALREAGRVELSLASDYTDGVGDFDLVVLDNVTPTMWPDANLLAFRAAPPEWLKRVGTVETPPIVDWDESHKLMRFVGLDNVQITEALRVEAPPWAESLVESTDFPLVMLGEHKRRRVIWLAFDVLESSWPLRVSFPIFVANAVDWLNPASVRESRLLVEAGSPLRYPIMSEVRKAVVTLPSGKRRTLEITPDQSELVFGETAHQGIYEVQVGTNQTQFAVNAINREESGNAPRSKLSIGEYREVESTALQEANIELWRWAAVLGLAVLLFEWWYYHRRTV